MQSLKQEDSVDYIVSLIVLILGHQEEGDGDLQKKFGVCGGRDQSASHHANTILIAVNIFAYFFQLKNKNKLLISLKNITQNRLFTLSLVCHDVNGMQRVLMRRRCTPIQRCTR